MATANLGGSVAWVVPTYKNGRSLWRFAESATAEARSAGIVRSSKTDRIIEFPNGGLFGIYSADNEDALRGEKFHLVVLDEAARISETAWAEAIQPTLADFDGDAILISTPKGRNWFWNEFQRGLSDNGLHQASWKAPSRDNPNPRIKRAAELAKSRVSELTYLQEWEAEFVSAEGLVFRRIQEAATLIPIDGPIDGRQYVAAVDPAASVDYTVVTIWDVADKHCVYFDRFNRVDYNVLEDRLHAVYQRFGCQSMTVEINGIGQSPVDHLQGRGMSLIPFTTTNATKQAVITGLQSAFEHGEIRIPNDPVMIGELLSFEAKRNASGSFSYSAPEGLHDDCVMSLAIGWNALSSSISGDLVA